MPTAPCLFAQCYQNQSDLGFFYSLNALGKLPVRSAAQYRSASPTG